MIYRSEEEWRIAMGYPLLNKQEQKLLEVHDPILDKPKETLTDEEWIQRSKALRRKYERKDSTGNDRGTGKK